MVLWFIHFIILCDWDWCWVVRCSQFITISGVTSSITIGERAGRGIGSVCAVGGFADNVFSLGTYCC